jgi:protein-tyrosine phosphatase
MRSVLFVCTGNYYRSRIAEILFNHFASDEQLFVVAISRGIRLNPAKNHGPLSPHAISYLELLNIPYRYQEFPKKLELSDLQEASRIILLDENEHRPMIRNSFPEWEDKVEYWNFEDDYIISPDVVLPGLHRKVKELFKSLIENSRETEKTNDDRC